MCRNQPQHAVYSLCKRVSCLRSCSSSVLMHIGFCRAMIPQLRAMMHVPSCALLLVTNVLAYHWPSACEVAAVETMYDICKRADVVRCSGLRLAVVVVVPAAAAEARAQPHSRRQSCRQGGRPFQGAATNTYIFTYIHSTSKMCLAKSRPPAAFLHCHVQPCCTEEHTHL
jgi:hypothetical protein